MPYRLFRSTLETFNTLVPKDRGVRMVARDLAYGPNPRQRLDLYAPKAPPADGRPRPIVVFFYGGSWSSGVRQGYGFVGRALAARGFLCAVPDYRLVPEAHYPKFVEDGAAAVRRVADEAANHGGDGRNLLLAGHSAGAYIAAMLALDPRWLGELRSAVCGFAGLAGPYDFLPLDSAVTRAAFGRASELAASQPIAHVSDDAPPALLLHGANDRTVSPRGSRKLAQLMTAAGGDARLKIYPAIDHVAILTALALPFRRRAPVLADLTAFAREVTLRT